MYEKRKMLLVINLLLSTFITRSQENKIEISGKILEDHCERKQLKNNCIVITDQLGNIDTMYTENGKFRLYLEPHRMYNIEFSHAERKSKYVKINTAIHRKHLKDARYFHFNISLPHLSAPKLPNTILVAFNHKKSTYSYSLAELWN